MAPPRRPAAWWLVPAKLIKMWRQSTQNQPPAELGGKEFDNVIAAYARNGFDAVEQLLATVATSPAMQANAYTVLARYALCSLGAGNINDVEGVAAGLMRQVKAAGFEIVWAKNPISVKDFTLPEGVQSISAYPLVRYPASFYQRDHVSPRLGFGEFLDIREFDRSLCFGPYISDSAVADKIAEIVQEASGPVFVFAITMENHGPLHLEKVEQSDIAELYSMPPPEGCEDLTIYLRHLRNADQMAAKLRRVLEVCDKPASLCWFGDHVPIMPTVYEVFGAPKGEVEYVIWHNRHRHHSQGVDLAISDLAIKWLGAAGLN